jgi:hypothetical protein
MIVPAQPPAVCGPFVPLNTTPFTFAQGITLQVLYKFTTHAILFKSAMIIISDLSNYIKTQTPLTATGHRSNWVHKERACHALIFEAGIREFGGARVRHDVLGDCNGKDGFFVATPSRLEFVVVGGKLDGSRPATCKLERSLKIRKREYNGD